MAWAVTTLLGALGSLWDGLKHMIPGSRLEHNQADDGCYIYVRECHYCDAPAVSDGVCLSLAARSR